MQILNLPSNTRLILTIIMIPQPKLSKIILNHNLPYREGYIFGSVTMPVFDLNRRLK